MNALYLNKLKMIKNNFLGKLGNYIFITKTLDTIYNTGSGMRRALGN